MARKPELRERRVTTAARVHRTAQGHKKMTIVVDLPSQLKTGTRLPVRVTWMEPSGPGACICGLINARNCPVYQ